MKEVSKRGSWDRVIATLGFDKFNSIPDMKEMKRLVKKLNSKNLRVVGLIDENGLLLEKRNITYEEVGKILDKWVVENFKVTK